MGLADTDIQPGHRLYLCAVLDRSEALKAQFQGDQADRECLIHERQFGWERLDRQTFNEGPSIPVCTLGLLTPEETTTVVILAGDEDIGLERCDELRAEGWAG